MQRLDPAELADLGEFLSRRLPPPSPSGWEFALTEAQNRGRLGALLDEASKTCADPRLREVRALFQPPRSARAGIALAAAAAALFAVASVVAAGGAARAALTPAPAGVSSAPPTVPSTEAVVGVQPPAAPEPQLAAPSPPAEPVDHPCARAGEGVVGWWYAGERAPGAAGDAITMTRDANVRVSAPGADNRFNARTRVACVLHRGDRLVLSEEALRVPPGVYWVPVRATDLR